MCVFVSDLDKGKDRDYEPTVRHYQDLFSQHSVTVSEVCGSDLFYPLFSALNLIEWKCVVFCVGFKI